MEGSPPINQIPSEPAVKRSKFLWRVFLISNFALGAMTVNTEFHSAKAFMFAQSGKKEKSKGKSQAPAEVSSIPEAAPEPVESCTTPKPVIVRQPIPDDQQRELFRWMLEEKRKAKPVTRQEKQFIDEQKAILKEFIRSDSIPPI